MAYELPASTKTYRASCPACSTRIQVGQPVIFAAPCSDLSSKPVAHHAACVQQRIAGKDA